MLTFKQKYNSANLSNKTPNSDLFLIASCLKALESFLMKHRLIPIENRLIWGGLNSQAN